MPTPVPLGELSWNISEGYRGKTLFLKRGRKNWLFLRVTFVSTFNVEAVKVNLLHRCEGGIAIRKWNGSNFW